MSLDEIKRRRAEDHTGRDKDLDATKKLLKERNTKKMQEKKQTKTKVNKSAMPKNPVPKNAPKAKVQKGGKK